MKWFRYYSEALHDPKVQKLPAPLFRHWVNLLCLANVAKERGVLPGADELAYGLRVSPRKAANIIIELVTRGLMDQEDDGALRPHNWRDRQLASDSRESEGRRKHDEGRRKEGAVWKNPPPTSGECAADAPPVRRGSAVTEEKQIQKQNREDTETEQKQTAAGAALGALSKKYEDTIGALTESVEQDLKDRIELIGDRAEEIIGYALDEAAAHNALNWSYVQSILLRLEEGGWPADMGNSAGDDAAPDSTADRHMEVQAERERERMTAEAGGQVNG